MERITIELDEATLQRVDHLGGLLGKSREEVIRSMVLQHLPAPTRLTEAEKQRMLAALDKFAKQVPTRSRSEMDAELRELRRARRHGGRRTRLE